MASGTNGGHLDVVLLYVGAKQSHFNRPGTSQTVNFGLAGFTLVCSFPSVNPKLFD